MEKIKFFLSCQRLSSFKALDNYLCEDIILKIIEYLTLDKKDSTTKVKQTNNLSGGQIIFLFKILKKI